MRTYLSIISIALLLSGCNSGAPTSKKTEAIAKKENQVKTVGFGEIIEAAHGKDGFMQKEAVQFNMILMFGGKQRLNGTLTLLTNSTAGKIAYADGRTLVYNNGEVYYSEGFTSDEASFAAYTWSYFFMLPYKITDAGTELVSSEHKMLQGEKYDTKKLIFKPETGASPNDWYLLYADKLTHQLRAAAYIVTAKGKPIEEAEKDPHAIEYLEYKMVDSIPVATEWKFWGWQPDSGFTNQLGEASLSNFKFLNVEAGFFSKSDGLMQLKSF